MLKSSEHDMSNRGEERRSEKLSIEEQVSAAVEGLEVDDRMMTAAAAITQQSCELLGLKSIGVDYGLARTGVAVTVGYEPKPLTIVSDTNSTKVAQEVVKYCASEQAKQIIIGLPLHKNGTEAPQSNLTREFASQVACFSMARLGPNVPLYLWDERYTSKEAAARFHSTDPGTSLRGTLDAEAACIILENYYKENGDGAELVQAPNDMKEACLIAWQTQQKEKEHLSLGIQEQREANMRKRQEAMDRARKLEAQMEENGTLGTSNKKRKKKKKKRAKRGKWKTF